MTLDNTEGIADVGEWAGRARGRALYSRSRVIMSRKGFFLYRNGAQSMRSAQLTCSKDVMNAWVQVADDSRATFTALEISLKVASMFPPMSPWEVMLTVARKEDGIQRAATRRRPPAPARSRSAASA